MDCPNETVCQPCGADRRTSLNTLIEKITVHEAVKGEDGSREQEVEEQKELETKIRQLHEMMEAAVQTAADAEKWIALMKQYVNPVELTAELL